MEKINAKLLNWASLLEENTREQAVRTATMPFVEPHLALMPDAHLGLGATVGSVIPTVGAIMPAAVGVDIGCGMIAVRTQYVVGDLPTDRRPVREAIERAVPLSAGAANRKVSREHTERRLEDLAARAEQAGFDPAAYAARWQLQLGTLGSGNHFIEVTADELDRVWLFLHSGSRGVGNRIAQRHIKVAQEHYALLNREEMMDRVVRQFSEWVDGDVERLEEINCHHNYTEREHHLGRDVWLTRKGAIDASAGRDGLIPGSMGTASYVVRGLGNPASFHSAPHGAGRTYSRSAARRTFTHEELRAAMVGIEYRDTDAFIDEIPAAYKDIDQVMADAADLVEVRHTLRQLVNVKGD